MAHEFKSAQGNLVRSHISFVIKTDWVIHSYNLSIQEAEGDTLPEVKANLVYIETARITESDPVSKLQTKTKNKK